MNIIPNSQLYEVAFAIGNSFNLDEMLAESLASYQKVLRCSNVAVVQYRRNSEGYYIKVDRFSGSSSADVYKLFGTYAPYLEDALDEPTIAAFWQRSLVGKKVTSRGSMYVTSLPNFGFLLLDKPEFDIDQDTLGIIQRLNAKLANSALKCKVSDDLQECLSKYDNLINLIPEMIFETDLKGNLIYANDVGVRTMGLAEGISNGVSYNVFDFIHKKDIARALSNLQVVLSSDDVSPREYTLVNTRGELIEGMFYSNRIIDKGKVVGLRGIVLDITERKRIEQGLKEKSEKLEMLLLGSDAGVWDWNMVTGETYINERWATMLGYSLGDISNNTDFWLSIIHQDDLEHFSSKFNGLLNGSTDLMHVDLRARAKDGSYKWISETARVVERDSMGNPIRVIGTHIDVTEAKKTEKFLKHSLLQQELISGIAISLNSLENFDSKINIVLRVVGEYLNVSRSYVFIDSEDGRFTSNTHEWCNEGVRSERESLQNLPYDTIPSWKKIVEESGGLFCDDTDTLPNDIRAITDTESILSIIEYPLYIDGRYSGFIGFDECVRKRVWTKWEIELLKTVSGVIANAFEREKMQRILQASYATNKAIVDSLPDRLLQVTRDGYLVNFNKVECGFCSSFDLKVGSHIVDAIPVEGVRIIEEGIRQCVGNGVFIKEIALTKDGEQMFFEFRFAESADETIIILARNITNRKRNEEAVRYNELKFRELFEQMPLGMTFNDFETGRFIDCNQELLNQLGYRRNELMDLTYWDITPSTYLKSDGQVLKKLLKVGRVDSYEKELIRKDGSRYPVEIAGFLTRDKNGRAIICSSIQDLSVDKQNIEALTRSEEKFRELFELSPIGLVFSDLDSGMYLDCNDNILKQTGYSREEFLQLSHYDITPKEYISNDHMSIESLKRTGRFGSIEKEYVKKDGTRYFVSVSGFLTRDKVGRAIVCSNVQDLTDAKSKTELLRRSEERFRGLFEQSPIGICLNDIKTSKFIEWNDALLNIIGYTASEFAELSYWDITPEEFKDAERKMAEQIKQKGYYTSFEKEFIAKDGRRIPVLLNGFLIHDEEGRELVWSNVQDISELKKRGEQLQVSEQKFRGLFEQLPIGVALTDNITQQYLECNNALFQMLGYTPDEIIGRHYWEITPDEYSEIDKSIAEQLNSTGRYGPFEKEFLKKNGERVPVVLNGYLSINSVGRPVVWTAIQDISQIRRNEKELRQSEEKFRSFVENASDVILSTSLQGHTLYVSPNIEKMLGYTQQEFMDLPLHRYVFKEDLDNFFKLAKDYQIRGIPSDTMEYRMLHKNGEWRWVQVTTSLNRDTNGNLYSISILRDFTKDKLAQEQLHRLSLVASKSTNTVVITDKSNAITWVNDAFTKLTGYSYEEVLGKNPGKLLQGPNTAKRDKDTIITGLKTGKPFRTEIYNYNKHGEGYWIEIYITPIYNDNGEITSYIAVENDITERKNSEEQIAKLTKGIENSPTIVVITDSDGKIEYVNTRFVEVTGYKFEEVVGQTPRVLNSGYQSRKIYEDLWSTIKAGKNWKGELYNRKKDGTLYWESATISPILNSNNEITHFIAIKEDITERKRLYEEMLIALDKAEKATRAKSEFLATMSHEIRTPMNGVIGMTSLLAKTQLTDEQIDYVNTIRNSGDALLSIINDILDFSKIESGRMEMEFYPFDVRQCVEDVADLFWIKASQKNISLRYSVSPKLQHQVLGDVTRLRQVLVNLVGNAIKFTEKGRVEIEVELLENVSTETNLTLLFKVNDTGLGIAKDKVSKLFSPFMQVDSSITRRFGGTGLGLAITKRLVDLMGGEIRVASVEGKGSAFSFELSFEKSDPIEDPKSAEIAGMSIFMDVDDPNVTYNLTNILQTIGVTCKSEIAGVSVIITDKGEYKSSEGMPIIFLKGINAKVEEENDTITILPLPLKINSLRNALHKVVIKKQHIASKQQEGVENVKLAERIPISILVAEDNTINQKLMNKSLSFYGYTADIAANGLEVIQALERQSYDLIFMDLQMPEMDGLEATKQIVSKFSNSRPVIIAMTASALGADKDACFEAGMDDYVSKPIKIDVIEEMIVKWCSAKK